MRVRWTRPALQDLGGIRAYIAEDNPRAAQKTASLLKQASRQLARFPRLGRRGTATGSRELIVSGTSYILIYDIEQDEVRVTAVVHGATDWKEGEEPRLA